MGDDSRAIKLYIKALDLSGVVVAGPADAVQSVWLGQSRDVPATLRRLGKNTHTIKLFWCASDMQAMLLAEAVRRDLALIARPERGGWFAVDAPEAVESVERNARDLGVVVQVNEQVEDHARQIVGRIEDQLKDMQRRGELKSVNKSYQTYRLDRTSQGLGAMAYPGWLENYKMQLVRAAANTSRTLDRHGVQNG